MKEVLVITDNITQYDRIKDFIGNGDFDCRMTYKHSNVKSAIWNHPDFIDDSESIIDVKRDIEYILNKYDLVFSVHCFQFFPKELVRGVRCINVHPGYNPINRGWYPQVFAIINDLQIGATIHEMDEKLDNGGIIAREFEEIKIDDTSLTIYDRVLEKEMELFKAKFQEMLNGSYQIIVPEGEGNMFTKKDFNALLELNMQEEGTFESFYNRLRALTHGEYKNAYFVDPISGKKIFVSINIEVEND
jgi:methionyl-tRNA formyltransferase